MTDKLKALALAAKETAHLPYYTVDEGDFKMAASPDVVLALIAENERLQAAMNPDWDVKSACMESVREHMEIAAGLRQEVERLTEQCGLHKAAEYKAQVEARTTVEHLEARIAELEGQEPFEYLWEPDGTFDIGQERQISPNSGPCHGWKITPLFLASGAAQKVVTIQTGELEDWWKSGNEDYQTLEGIVLRIAAQAAPAAQEPVAWQYRTKPAWDEMTKWSEWAYCSKMNYDDYVRAIKRGGDWLYEVRAFVLASGAAPKSATIADAPNVLNTNDKAMWVLGFNAAHKENT